MKPANIRATTLSLAIVMALAAPGLHAQDAAPAEAPAAQSATELDGITVTARRRVESIMDVPVAVSAFGEEQLKDLQASDVTGLQGAVPNLNIVQGRGSANSANVFIRGIGQPDALQSFDPGVGMYVDDVYYSRINGSMFSLFDVQQIEVLRGPQGTLYGKNSTGGAIKVNTKNPFDDQGAAVEFGMGSFGRIDGRAYLGEQLSDSAAPASAATAKPSAGEPLWIATTKPITAPVIIMPSTPRFRTPDFSTTNSPMAAKISGVAATRKPATNKSGLIAERSIRQPPPRQSAAGNE